MNLVLIGGGNLALNENKLIHEKMLSMSKKAKPSLLYIPLSEKSIVNFKNCMNDFNVDLKIYQELSDIDDADIIYIGGGNTENMIKRFNDEGITKKLIENIDKKIIAGISAGAIFWFKKYYSDTYAYSDCNSIYNYKMLDGINYFNAYISPHFNEDGKEYFSDYLDGNIGIALENNTALFVYDNDLDYVLERKNSAIYIYLDGVMDLLTKNNKNIIFEKVFR